MEPSDSEKASRWAYVQRVPFNFIAGTTVGLCYGLIGEVDRGTIAIDLLDGAIVGAMVFPYVHKHLLGLETNNQQRINMSGAIACGLMLGNLLAAYLRQQNS